MVRTQSFPDGNLIRKLIQFNFKLFSGHPKSLGEVTGAVTSLTYFNIRFQRLNLHDTILQGFDYGLTLRVHLQLLVDIPYM
jgi:hypothetical protein